MQLPVKLSIGSFRYSWVAVTGMVPFRLSLFAVLWSAHQFPKPLLPACPAILDTQRPTAKSPILASVQGMDLCELLRAQSFGAPSSRAAVRPTRNPETLYVGRSYPPAYSQSILQYARRGS